MRKRVLVRSIDRECGRVCQNRFGKPFGEIQMMASTFSSAGT